jgi:hypothetical protein
VHRLELVVVEMEEAERLLQVSDVPHLRLALILVDSAVELMLFRLVQDVLHGERFDFSRLHVMEAAVARGEGKGLEAENDRLRPLVTSKTRRRKIDRDFNVKIDFLVEKNELPAVIGPVLKKLHTYRNDTYHRDEHRVDVLRTAVLIYFDAACTVLEHYDVGVMTSDGSVPPGLTRFADEATALLDPFRLPGLVAQTLRSEVGLDVAAVGAFLSEHLLGRLEDLESSVAYIEADMTGSDVRPGDGYLALQVKDGDVEAVFDADVMRRRGYPLSAANMPVWIQRAADVANAATRDEMFTRFAAIEDEIEELERDARRAVCEIDDAANMH